jgi:phage terminase large subunit-like protein
MEYPELKRPVREQYEWFRPAVVLIADKTSGTPLIQELIAEGLHAVTRYQPQTATIENGLVHVLDRAPWLDPADGEPHPSVGRVCAFLPASAIAICSC